VSHFRLWRSLGILAIMAAIAASNPARAQTGGPDPSTVSMITGLTIKTGLEAGGQVVWEKDPFWNLSATFAPTVDYDPERHWWEGYVKPSLRADYALNGTATIYSGVSAIGAYTWLEDVFLEGNTGAVLPEDYYGGLKLGDKSGPASLDISAGAQQYKIGSGMIIATGGGNGFERGAMIFSPRRAWEMTALVQAASGNVSFDAFYLNPNELDSNDTRTELAGGKLEIALGKNESLGVAVGKILHSEAPYIQAAPGGIGPPSIVLDGRNGMEIVHAYTKFNPLRSELPGFWVGAEGVYERNDRIQLEAWAGRFEVGNAFVTLPWTPVLSYAYQTFSGDDPDTAALERFDPLFYDGAHGTWATGGNASLTLINTNINAHRLSLVLTPTQQDVLTFRYWHIRANELDSPLQFGQATRLVFNSGVPTLATGVPDAHLSDDFLAEYTRIVSKNIFVTSGFAASFPGRSIEDITNGDAKDWFGAYGNIVFMY